MSEYQWRFGPNVAYLGGSTEVRVDREQANVRIQFNGNLWPQQIVIPVWVLRRVLGPAPR